MSQRSPLVAHLVGSVPLSNAEEVFRRVGGALAGEIKRLPDGETGRRNNWIGFVRRALSHNKAFETAKDLPPFRFTLHDGTFVREWPLLRFVPGVDPARVEFETGYADDAIASFSLFDRLQRDGIIPAGVKYQICAATPLAIGYMYFAAVDYADFARAYAEHLAGEIAAVAAQLPMDRIAWQWDVCQEVLMAEGYFPQTSNWRDQVTQSLAVCGAIVPEPIELGYHFCYGSPQDKHCILPQDLGKVVDMTNAVLARVPRSVQYVHYPVLKERNDAAYFAPLARLALKPETELYLGCVHPGDEAGNAGKLAAASAVAPIAGIGSECGWGRGDPKQLDAILAAHKALIEA